MRDPSSKIQRIGSAGLVGLASMGMLAMAAPTEQVRGQLIDLSCYAENKQNTGNHHEKKGMTCAQACALEGFEVGLLTRDGSIYHVRGGLTARANDKLVPHIGQSVIIKGVVTQEKGERMITSDRVDNSGME